MPTESNTLNEQCAEVCSAKPRGWNSNHRFGAILRSAAVISLSAGVLFCGKLAGASETIPALFAQEEAVESGGPSYVLDGLILLVLVCAAVYSVCRAGRRN
jgi:hypothetical protein